LFRAHAVEDIADEYSAYWNERCRSFCVRCVVLILEACACC